MRARNQIGGDRRDHIAKTDESIALRFLC